MNLAPNIKLRKPCSRGSRIIHRRSLGLSDITTRDIRPDQHLLIISEHVATLAVRDVVESLFLVGSTQSCQGLTLKHFCHALGIKMPQYGFRIPAQDEWAGDHGGEVSIETTSPDL